MKKNRKSLIAVCAFFVLPFLAGCTSVVKKDPSLNKPEAENNDEDDNNKELPEDIQSRCKHSFVTAQVAPTCESAGSRVDVCSYCKIKIETPLPALGHSLVLSSNQVGVISPTCTSGGTAVYKCSREGCNHTEIREVGMLGHDFEYSFYSGTTGCGYAGMATCSRCGAMEALSEHDCLEYVSGSKNSPTIYYCGRSDCEYKSMSFTPNDLTDESKQTLYMDSDTGSCAFTSAHAMGEYYTIARDDRDVYYEKSFLHDTPKFDETHKGDFIELKFELTKNQANFLGNCRLYFESDDRSYNEDFDPFFLDTDEYEKAIAEYKAFYIDGEEKGEEVFDSRYILYVDGERKYLDHTIMDSFGESNDIFLKAQHRKEYCFPYMFSFHEGVNTITIYRGSGTHYQIIFGFNFRSYNPRELPNVYTCYANGWRCGDAQPILTTKNESGYELIAADCEGQNAPTPANKKTCLGKNGVFDDVWDVTGIERGRYAVYIKGAYCLDNGGSYFSADQNIDIKDDFLSNNGGGKTGARYTIKTNDGDEVDIASKYSYVNTGLSKADYGAWTKIPVAELNISDGTTSITLHNKNNGYQIWIYAIRLIRIGNYYFPNHKITLVEGRAKVECECFTNTNGDIEEVIDEGRTCVYTEPQRWPQVELEYTSVFAEAMTVKLVLAYKWLSAPWGNIGVAELYLDGQRIPAAVSSGIFGVEGDGPIGEWATTESVTFDVTEGKHVIKLVGGAGSEVMLDYFELVDAHKN